MKITLPPIFLQFHIILHPPHRKKQTRSMKMDVSWDFAPRGLMEIDKRFGNAY
jgi:hypothetical protein